MGNLTRDPEIKSVGGGSQLANLSLAVNRRYTTAGGEKREEVTYVDVTFWGKQAELFTRLNIRKGTPLLIEGRLHLETWDDKQSGQKRSKLKVVGEAMQLLGAKREDSGTQSQSQPQSQSQSQSHPPDRREEGESAGERGRGGDDHGGYSDEPF